jgi:hypothetical protein
VRAVCVSGDAAIEASVERELELEIKPGACPSPPKLDKQPSAGCGGALLRQTGEEVFLAQLYRRALMLNEGFQEQILRVVRRHQVATASCAESQPPAASPVPRSGSIDGTSAKKGALFSSLFFGSQRSLSQVQTLPPPHLVAAEGLARLGSETTGSLSEWSWRMDMAAVVVDCDFEGGAAPVEVHQAPVKTWVPYIL